MENISRFTTSLLMLCVLGLVGSSPRQSSAQPAGRDAALQHAALIEEPVKIPSVVPGPNGSRTFMLDGLVVRPALDERLPLAIFTHGTPRVAEDRRKSEMAWFARIARDFARRGWVAAVVIRRGHGTSEGEYEEGIRCADPDYIRAGRIASIDLENAIAFFSQLPSVDKTRVLGIGHSTGGFAWLAESSKAPSNLVGVINFAGGHGSMKPRENCKEGHMLEAMREFGKTSRIPSLWLYSENDSYNIPGLARRMQAAFAETGGIADLKIIPPYENDGHDIVLKGGASTIWTPFVDDFLRRLKLPSWSERDAHPELLTRSDTRTHYARYLAASPEKAFAISNDGTFDWWWSGQSSIEEARQKALADCEKRSGRKCRIFAINFAPVPRD
jgi:dienelactone hydrolase